MLNLCKLMIHILCFGSSHQGSNPSRNPISRYTRISTYICNLTSRDKQEVISMTERNVIKVIKKLKKQASLVRLITPCTCHLN